MQVKVIGSGSKGNAYIVSDGPTKILLDCGLPIKDIRIACGFTFCDVRACFVTHSHMDHCKSMADVMKSGVTVCIPSGEVEALNPEMKKKISGHHKLHILNAGHFPDTYREIHVGTLKIIPFRVAHDTPEPVGYLVFSEHTHEKLVYFTDTYTVPVKFVGLTHIIGEVNYCSDELWEHIDDGSTDTGRAKRLFRSHMSLETFLDFLEQNDMSCLQQIYICHMSDSHGHEEKIKEAVQKQTGVEVIVC